MKNSLPILLAVVGATLAGAAASIAHDPGALTPDIQIKVDGANQLVADYPFDRTPVVSVFDTGFADVFAHDDPGFLPGEADTPPSGLMPPPLGTQVGIEILALDSNVQLRVGTDTLDEPFETAVLGTHDDVDLVSSDLHRHGDWQLLHDASTGRRFGEGRISFRLFDTSGTHAPSAPHTLTLSNGFLPAVTAPDKASVRCTNAVAKETGKLVAAAHGALTKCLNAGDAFGTLGSGAKKALKTCDLDESGKGAIGRIAGARAKALTKIDKLCGPLGAASEPYTLGAIEAHLDMARCRAEELIGAAYNNARDVISAAIEGALFASACVAETCVGGLADGLACTSDDDCRTKTLVSAATVCMAESGVAE